LLEIARGELRIELMRQKLAAYEDFEPYVAFQRIDRSRNEFMVAEEIQEFLKDNKIYSVTMGEA